MKISALTILATLISVSFAQEKSETHSKEHKMEMKKESHQSMDCCKDEKGCSDKGKKNQSMKDMDASENAKISLVREGEIDLQAIDKNNDGKVYQDMMCWNVISDEPGECPQCGMTLKEVSLEKAKENLLKNDYRVKD